MVSANPLHTIQEISGVTFDMKANQVSTQNPIEDLASPGQYPKYFIVGERGVQKKIRTEVPFFQ
jgi:hypothetical protein